MGHILTEFIQQIFPLLFQRTLMYKQRIDICEYRQSCTYMRNIWNFLWVMLQFCKRIHNFGWGNPIHLQHSWLLLALLKVTKDSRWMSELLYEQKYSNLKFIFGKIWMLIIIGRPYKKETYLSPVVWLWEQWWRLRWSRQWACPGCRRAPRWAAAASPWGTAESKPGWRRSGKMLTGGLQKSLHSSSLSPCLTKM